MPKLREAISKRRKSFFRATIRWLIEPSKGEHYMPELLLATSLALVRCLMARSIPRVLHLLPNPLANHLLLLPNSSHLVGVLPPLALRLPRAKRAALPKHLHARHKIALCR